MVDENNSTPITHKANYTLQQKIGKGPIDLKTLDRAQEIIEKSSDDFEPLAMSFLEKLKISIEVAQIGDHPGDELIAGMTSPVMELKANAKMFQYELVSALANIMLGFLETINKLDKDAISIVSAHHTTIQLIIMKKMKGNGGEHGQLLQTELRDAVHRYFSKLQG